MNGRFSYIKPFCVFPEFFDIFLRNILVCYALFIGSFDDFVVNVGEILNKTDFIASVFEVAAQNIKNAQRSCVADVNVVINSRSAGIDFDFTFFDGFQFFLLPCESVKYFHF